ncbi:unnamed protein product, partial [Hapterophycus canaliculatus]
IQDTYDDRDLEKALKAFAGVSSEAYRSKVEPGCRLSKQIGNTYTASVFANIVCLVSAHGAALEGETALVFSYGSGAVATMYELHFRDTTADAAATPSPFTVARIAEAVDLAARLADRERLPPAELDAALAARSSAHSLASGGGESGAAAFVPGFPLDRLFPGAFYLETVGVDGVRAYGRRPKDAPRTAPATAAKSSPSPPPKRLCSTTSSESLGAFLPMVVVTGVACGLPGQAEVFELDNLARLLGGQSCVQGLSEESTAALVEKNVVQVPR